MHHQMPKPGEFYRHFKGGLYQIITIANDSETMEELVVYKALYGSFGDFVRPLWMFTEKLDPEQYPDAGQAYRFERIRQPLGTKQEQPSLPDQADGSGKEDENGTADPLLLEFLDLSTIEEKLGFLQKHRTDLSASFLAAAAQSMDFTLKEASYQEFVQFLHTKGKYERNRLR